MRLQEILTAPCEQCSELYFRGNTTLSAGDTLSFDTYYNSFCYTRYKAYTSVERVDFSCCINGSALVELCLYDGKEHILCSSECNGSAILGADLASLPANGFIYPKFTALTDCRFINGEYSSKCKAADNINVCIAICTYKREKYVLNNMELLKNYKFSFLSHVFVIDNGKTLDSEALSDGFISVHYNKNFGGTGGFTRGLIEAHDGGFSHVILMDDDIEIMPQTLEQMTVFISLLKPQYSESWFSAAMLPIDKPWYQFELGADWSRNCKIHHCRHQIDVRSKENLLENLSDSEPLNTAEYGAWWTLCMPVSVTKNGLPFPFFIKFDDVEYGVRNSKDIQIITMNGIAVRHEAFDRKTSFVLDYYTVRNEMVMYALYGKNSTFRAFKRFWYEILKEIILYRYENCNLVFRAANDFLKGMDFFLSCNEEELNNELYGCAPKLIPLSNIPSWNENLRCDDHCKANILTPKILFTMGGHLIPSCFLNKEITALPLSRISMTDLYGRKAVIQYQLGGNNGILTERCFRKFCKYFFKAAVVSIKLVFGFRKSRRSIKSSFGIITSFDFWRKHLDL